MSPKCLVEKYFSVGLFYVFFQVIDGTYNGAKLNCTEQAILSDNKIDKSKGISLPLEIKPSGQFEPLYRTPLSVQVCLYLFLYWYTYSVSLTKRLYHPIKVIWIPSIFFRDRRMVNCRFCPYLFTEQLSWLIVMSLRNIHHQTSFSSIYMIREM